MTDLSTIKKNIKRWNAKRKTNAGLQYLTAGFGFEISKEEWQEQWQGINSQNSINVYIGVDEDDETCFYLVESGTDAAIITEQNKAAIVEKKFTKENRSQNAVPNTIPENLSIVDQDIAMKRAFKWFLFCNVWYDEALQAGGNADDKGVVRVFSLPIIDFHQIFNETNADSAFVFFGIQDEVQDEGEIHHNVIELMVAGVDYSKYGNWSGLNVRVENVTIPHPPFPIVDSGFSLLEES